MDPITREVRLPAAEKDLLDMLVVEPLCRDKKHIQSAISDERSRPPLQLDMDAIQEEPRAAKNSSIIICGLHPARRANKAEQKTATNRSTRL